MWGGADYRCKNIRVKRILFSLAALLIFLSSGGSLAVAGVGCYIFLLFIIRKALWEHKVELGEVIVFCTGVFGALVNTLAPGNFVRHALMDTGVHFVKAAQLTPCVVVNEIDWLVNGTSFYSLMLLALLIGLVSNRKVICCGTKTILLILLEFILPFVSIYPVILGYSSDSYMPNRCIFILDVVLMTEFLLLSWRLGGYLRTYYFDSAGRKQIIFVLVIVAIAHFSGNEIYNYKDLACVKISRTLNGGQYKEYYRNCKELCDFIEGSPEKVILIEELPEEIEGLKGVTLSRDSNDWINIAIAEYYGKESVSLMNE